MFSLAKLSYYTCNDEEKDFYNVLETLKIDIQPCCIDIMNYQKKKSKLNIEDNNIEVKYMEDEDYPMSEKAAASGHLICLAFTEVCGFPWTRSVRANAAKNVIEYNRFRSFDEVVCQVAALNGQLECLVYLHNNGCLWDDNTCKAAAEGGHIDFVERGL
ncbi:uncharacterized protein LOC126555365 [Aphis gossypii]|uniref:uncharacterized protein LOC126555365 n=1 Tax=Aphis gossypii TaxID=80765 RepID=UPI002159970C|nr:uncharacterized protein LOC126555365 [Aphis gossypii]